MAWWIFQNLVVTAALALVVAAVCRVGRIGPVARHALWVLVLVKFVTPPLVVWPWTVPDPFGVAALDSRAGARLLAGVVGESEPGATTFGDDARAAAVVVAAGRGKTGEPDAARLAASASPWILGVWLAGSLFLLGIEGVRLARLSRRVRAAGPVDPAIVDRVAALAARLGIPPVPVVGVAGSSSPAVWGFGRPRLIWPDGLAADVSDACVDGLLLHELAHVKRRDHLVGWVELAAGVAWWWNPLFWYVRSARREQAELACDAWVISALPDGRRAYAESLLALSAAGVGDASPAAVLGIRAVNRRVLERRLVMIMQGRAPVRLPWSRLEALSNAAFAGP